MDLRPLSHEADFVATEFASSAGDISAEPADDRSVSAVSYGEI